MTKRSTTGYIESTSVSLNENALEEALVRACEAIVRFKRHGPTLFR